MDLLTPLLFILFALLAPLQARADFDLSSPGPLSAAHAGQDDSNKKCELCHEKGKQVSANGCLNCHKELKSRIDELRGFHGHMASAQQQKCGSCHPEHAGRELVLIHWDKGKENFDHEQTGYSLKGKHAKVKCEQCHRNEFITAPEVKAGLAARPNWNTLLGLSTKCSACHFDEHRGQVGKECQKCHTETQWKPAEGFKHSATKYPLTGKHAAVACEKCHAQQEDTKTGPGVIPAPKKKAFMQLSGIPHESCENCHKDAHEGRFGKDCQNCHATDDWHSVTTKLPTEKSFHDKTRYPLRGAHVTVACNGCHEKRSGKAAAFKGLKFENCTDCHMDAHLGQFKKKECSQCHTVDGFLPPIYDRKHHDETRYPLQGAHRTVPCNACHKHSPELEKNLPANIRTELARKNRKQRICQADFKFSKPLSECQTCHADPHGGQFMKGPKPKECNDCHKVSSFKDVTFDHNKDSRYPLTGKHEKVACGSCHQKLFRGVGMECEDCHDDIHLGQFTAKGTSRTACKRCHVTEDFKKKLLFDHNDKRFSDFPLAGKHSAVKCEKCHVPVKTAAKAQTIRYQDLPKTCAGCHQDEHKGVFRRFEP